MKILSIFFLTMILASFSLANAEKTGKKGRNIAAPVLNGHDGRAQMGETVSILMLDQEIDPDEERQAGRAGGRRYGRTGRR